MKLKVSCLFLFSMILSSCGQAGEKSEPLIVGSDKLLQYYEKFKADAFSIGRTLPKKDILIMFGETRTNEFPLRVGYCNFLEPRVVVINKEWFDNAPEENREVLMYHELGHCVLDLDHTTDCNDFFHIVSCNSPKSLMYPTIGWKGYFQNKEWYIQELFSNTNYFPGLRNSNCVERGNRHGR